MDQPISAENPVFVLACLLQWVAGSADGLGLFEADDHPTGPVADLPEWDELEEFLAQLLGSDNRMTDELLRDKIYDALVVLSDDAKAREILNRSRSVSPSGLLLLGQVHWNIKASDRYAKFPRKPHPATKKFPVARGIPVLGSESADFATMKQAKRMNQQDSEVPSTGGGRRKAAARLSVLVARSILESRTTRFEGVLWPTPILDDEGDLEALLWEDEQTASHPGFLTSSAGPVVVGAPAPVGTEYQLRLVDHEIEDAWSTNADRRVWLCGPPGVGKTFSARSLFQAQAEVPDEPSLRVWVDSADVDSVRAALTRAADELRARGMMPPGAGSVSDDETARAVINALANASWPWLVVFDNADADALTESKLIPNTGNHGRVLITTNTRKERLRGHGTALDAALFDPEEADQYLRRALPSAAGDERQRLADTLGHHPLALSIASATIDIHGLTVSDWLDDFDDYSMDEAGDERDRGGYPLLVSATWRAVLARAAGDLPPDLLERAAVVAAIQALDGHPTWLWGDDELDHWVGGGKPLSRRGHRPPDAVQRLIDQHLITLRGPWSDGQLEIHQLAARAIREAAGTKVLAEGAAVVARAWLRRYASHALAKRSAHANMTALYKVHGLDERTRSVVANLGVAWEPRSLQDAIYSINGVKKIEPLLKRGGAVGTAAWAQEWADCAQELEHTNTPDSVLAIHEMPTPQTMRRGALDAVMHVLTDDTLLPHFRAEILELRADLLSHLGDDDEAQHTRRQALALYDTATTEQPDLDVRWRRRHAQLRHKLTGPDPQDDVVLQDILGGPQDPNQSDNETDRVLARRNMSDAMELAESLGRRDVSKQLLSQLMHTLTSELNWIFDSSWLERGARMQAADGEWSAALECADVLDALVSSNTASLLRTSILLHLGRVEDAYSALKENPDPDSSSREPSEKSDLDVSGLYRQLSTDPTLSDVDPAELEEVEEFLKEAARRTLTNLLFKWAYLARDLGRHEEEARLCEGELALSAELAGADLVEREADDADMRLRAGMAWNQAGAAHQETSLAYFQEVITASRVLLVADSDPKASRRWAEATYFGATTLVELDRPDDAFEMIAALMPDGRIPDGIPVSPQLAIELFATYLKCGHTSGELAHLVTACSEFSKTVRDNVTYFTKPDDFVVTKCLASFVEVRRRLGEFSRHDEAVKLAGELVAAARTLAEKRPDLASQIELLIAIESLSDAVEAAGHAAEHSLSLERLLAQGRVVVNELSRTSDPAYAALDFPGHFRRIAQSVVGNDAALSVRFHQLADLAEPDPDEESA